MFDDEHADQFISLIEGEERSRGAGRREVPAEPAADTERAEPAVAEPETMDQS